MAEPPDRDASWVDEIVSVARASLGKDDAGELDEAKETAESHGYRFRLRDDDVVVIHPLDWLDEDGIVKEDVDPEEALKVELGGSGGVEEARSRNDEVMEDVEDLVDDGDLLFNVRRFVEYCENHHAAAVDEVTRVQVEEFLEEYYPRNVWASREQEDKLQGSLATLFEHVERDDLVDDLWSGQGDRATE